MEPSGIWISFLFLFLVSTNGNNQKYENFGLFWKYFVWIPRYRLKNKINCLLMKNIENDGRNGRIFKKMNLIIVPHMFGSKSKLCAPISKYKAKTVLQSPSSHSKC